MIDPISALGVAASAVQFLDFGLEALSLCRQIRDDVEGTTKANKDLELYSKDLKELSEELQARSKNPNEAGRRICRIAQQCYASADELQTVLLKVREAGNAKLRGTIKTTFRAMKEKKTIELLQNKLKDHRQQLDSAIIQDIRNRVNLLEIQQSNQFGSLKTSVQALVTQLQSQQTVVLQNQERTGKEISIIKAQNERLSSVIAVNDAQTHTKIDTLHTGMDDQFSRLHLRNAKDELLISLFYPEHAARREAVKPPAEQTFDWVFERDGPPESRSKHFSRSSVKWSNFSEWLQCSNSLYWISGKAGSGKSTLMAHIINDPRTKQELEKWAADRPLHILSFFFWRVGSQLQRSITGLLRSLLFQLLDEIPGLAEKVMGEFPMAEGRITIWTEPKLIEMMDRALRLADDHRICLFVDGLDEFDGESDELLDLLFHLQDTSVKFCVSSRPELIFTQELSSYSHLRMDQLNYEDIATFVRSRLESYEEYRDFVWQITKKANGVFLWAALATQSIVRGIQSGDEKEVLEQRLLQLSPDLTTMFRNMLGQIEAVHKRSLGFFCRIVEMEEGPPSIALIAACLMKGNISSYSDFWRKCAQVETQIIAQSRGILEITQLLPKLEHIYTIDYEIWAIPESKALSTLPSDRARTISARRPGSFRGVWDGFDLWESMVVGWIHRSAFDFVFNNDPAAVHGVLELPPRAEVADAIVAAKLALLIIAPAFVQFDDTSSDVRHGPNERLESLCASVEEYQSISPVRSESMLDEAKSVWKNFDLDELKSKRRFHQFTQIVPKIDFNHCDDALISELVFWENIVERGLYLYAQKHLNAIGAGPNALPILTMFIRRTDVVYSSDDAFSFEQLLRFVNLVLLQLVRHLQNSRSARSGDRPISMTILSEYGALAIHDKPHDLAHICTLRNVIYGADRFSRQATYYSSSDEAAIAIDAENASVYREVVELLGAKPAWCIFQQTRPCGSRLLITAFMQPWGWMTMQAEAERDSRSMRIREDTPVTLRVQRHRCRTDEDFPVWESSRDSRDFKQDSTQVWDVCGQKGCIDIDLELTASSFRMPFLERGLSYRFQSIPTASFRSRGEVLREIWRNASGQLSAWQQLCVVACIRLAYGSEDDDSETEGRLGRVIPRRHAPRRMLPVSDSSTSESSDGESMSD